MAYITNSSRYRSNAFTYARFFGALVVETGAIFVIKNSRDIWTQNLIRERGNSAELLHASCELPIEDRAIFQFAIFNR
jgi:hypothetical protein